MQLVAGAKVVCRVPSLTGSIIFVFSYGIYHIVIKKESFTLFEWSSEICGTDVKDRKYSGMLRLNPSFKLSTLHDTYSDIALKYLY